jgi:hypothetical protein
MTRNVRSLVSRTNLCWMAAVVAALLLLFCLSSAVPALAGENGCHGSDSSARICAQSGIANPIPVVLEQAALLQVDGAATTPVPVPRVTAPVAEFGADPPAPRAPPFSLV